MRSTKNTLVEISTTSINSSSSRHHHQITKNTKQTAHGDHKKKKITHGTAYHPKQLIQWPKPVFHQEVGPFFHELLCLIF